MAFSFLQNLQNTTHREDFHRRDHDFLEAAALQASLHLCFQKPPLCYLLRRGLLPTQS